VDTAAEGLEPPGLVSIAQRSQRPQRGNWTLWAKGSQWLPGLWARNTRIGESIAQRSQRPQRGNWHLWARGSPRYRGFRRETRGLGKASHRGHRGGIGIYGPEALRGCRGFGRETREKDNIGNQRPIAIEELTKRKSARIKVPVRRQSVGKPASENPG
jgi:hypothetical protein